MGLFWLAGNLRVSHGVKVVIDLKRGNKSDMCKASFIRRTISIKQLNADLRLLGVSTLSLTMIILYRIVIGGSCRVTLVDTFGFLPQNFGRWWGPMNGTFSFYECRLNGGDTQKWLGHSIPSCWNQIDLNFLHSQVVGMLKHCFHICSSPHAHYCPWPILWLSHHLIYINYPPRSCWTSITFLVLYR